MKFWWLIFLIILCVSSTIVIATTKYEDFMIPINMSVENDWNGSCEIKFSSENDDLSFSDKKFDCWTNKTFKNIEITLENAIETSTTVDDANLSKAMRNLTRQYYDFITYANYTRDYMDKYAEMKSAHELVVERYTVCKDEKDILKKDNGNLTTESTTCKEELITTTSERDRLSTELSSCTKDLTKAQSDKNTWAFGALFLGILGTYFVLRRNKPKPDEAKHFGNLPEGFPGFEEPHK